MSFFQALGQNAKFGKESAIRDWNICNFQSPLTFRGQLAVSFKEGRRFIPPGNDHICPLKGYWGDDFPSSKGGIYEFPGEALAIFRIESNTPLRRTAGNTTTNNCFWRWNTRV